MVCLGKAQADAIAVASDPIPISMLQQRSKRAQFQYSDTIFSTKIVTP